MPKRTAQKPKTKPVSLVTFLLDRSGSMSFILDSTIEGFNTYLTQLKAERGANILFTFLQFDSQSLDKIHVAEPIGAVPLLTAQTFVPRGATPLIDAAMKTIRAVEASLRARDDKPRVVICFQTDGHENASREWSWADLNALIKQKQQEGWQFNFMGASIDSYQQAAQMGIGVGNTVSYNAASESATQTAFTGLAMNTATYSAGLSQTTQYTLKQKLDSGDAFIPEEEKNKAIPKGLNQ